MRDYELVTILDPGLEDAQIQEIVQKITDFVGNHQGVVQNVRTSEVRRLAYRLKKKNEGVYGVVNFQSTPSTLPELDRFLKLEERVLRHRVFVAEGAPLLPQVPAAVAAQSASTRGEPEKIAEPSETAGEASALPQAGSPTAAPGVEAPA